HGGPPAVAADGAHRVAPARRGAEDRHLQPLEARGFAEGPDGVSEAERRGHGPSIPAPTDRNSRCPPTPAFLSAPLCDGAAMPALATAWSPAQQRIIELLRRRPDDAPVGADVVAALHAELEERLAPVAERVPAGAA